MDQVDLNSTRRQRLWATLTAAAMTSLSAVTIAFPAASNADPQPAPSPDPAAPPSSVAIAPTPLPATAPAAAPPPASASTPNAQSNDPNAVSPPAVDPNAPEPGRVNNAVGGFSFVVPAGWVESDASHLDYGSALLSRVAGEPSLPEQAAPVANDTRVVLGRLDQKLYASAEATNSNAAARLGSDMGEFFMPYPGTRVNQETILLNANGVAGNASYYEVKFSDPAKPNGQIWTGVIGSPAADTPNAEPPQRWFVVWLGTANSPVDKNAAQLLAESIRSLTPPSAPAVAGAPGVPAPAQAPAGETTPAPGVTPSSVLPA